MRTWCLIKRFHTRAKIAVRMIIRVTVILMTVFWPVCTQISISKGNLNSNDGPEVFSSDASHKSPSEITVLNALTFKL